MSTKEAGLQSGTTETKTSRLLVICVDRDDDIGIKAGVVTPVVGRNACIEAAQRLALEDPEDADSNSIFAAVKTFEDLTSKGYQAEVALVSGTQHKGVQGDEKIVSQVKTIAMTFAANGAVIVSDGEDDESVIPIIQNVLPIVSVKRVVMRASRTVEYSYAVLGRYLKTIAFDSKYSKFFLGVPGMLLLIGGVATVLGLTREIFAVLVSILGGAFLIRAFDVDRAWANWNKPTPGGFIRTFTLVAGIVMILASLTAGIGAAVPRQARGQDEDQGPLGKFTFEGPGPPGIEIEDQVSPLAHHVQHPLPGGAVAIAELFHPFRQRPRLPQAPEGLGADEEIVLPVNLSRT